MSAKKTDRFVVVVAKQATGNWARVAFGLLEDSTEARVVLRDARQALYYSRTSGGEFGLAAIGPGEDSRITAPVPMATLFSPGVILDCCDAAIKAWRDAPIYAGK